MFAELIRRLTDPAPAPLRDTDARLALGALLVRLARADGDYSSAEVARIDAILANRYGLSDPTALRRDCEALEKEAPDTVRFTRAIYGEFWQRNRGSCHNLPSPQTRDRPATCPAVDRADSATSPFASRPADDIPQDSG